MAWLLEFRLVGPVEAVVGGRPVALPAAKPRALLAVLLLDRNRVVSVGRLVEDLWGDEPPETATKALQGYVSQLRKALGADRLLTKPPGYSLRVEAGELDLDRFERLLREGRELLGAGDSKAAAKRLAEALELWRGTPFAEFESEPFARDAGARLEDARLAALEERIEADLALGRHARLIPELEELVAREPLRQRPAPLLRRQARDLPRPVAQRPRRRGGGDRRCLQLQVDATSGARTPGPGPAKPAEPFAAGRRPVGPEHGGGVQRVGSAPEVGARLVHGGWALQRLAGRPQALRAAGPKPRAQGGESCRQDCDENEAAGRGGGQPAPEPPAPARPGGPRGLATHPDRGHRFCAPAPPRADALPPHAA